MAIAVFRSLDGESVDDVANRLFQKWRRGLSTREIYLLFFLACVGITFVRLAWNVSNQRGYTAGRRGWSSSGPGGWYGGGWGGGGWSGGGSSGGGFSGGGGSSGGGGASGSW